MEEGSVRDQKHLQLSAVSRHLEATEGSLCVERIVAVDPRERMRGALLPGEHAPASRDTGGTVMPNARPLGKVPIT